MQSKHLATYLRDHLAGSQAAIEIMDHIEAEGNAEAVAMVRDVRAEIVADRDTLVALMKQLDISNSGSRRIFGWLSEKVVELKLKVDDPADGPLRMMESIELLALGISGKLALWNALSACKTVVPQLGEMDYANLTARAQSQSQRVERVRTHVAQIAFAQ